MTRNIDISDNIKLLIIGNLKGTNTKEDSQRLNDWLNANDQNWEHFNKIKVAWILAEKLSIKKRFDEDRLWNKLRSKLNDQGKESLITDHREIDYRQILRIAATWLIIFMLGSLITYLYTKPNKELLTQKTTITSPLGAKSNIILPDGSSVWLNAGSILEYNGDFNSDTREVKLTGEGFFQVTTNRSKPFMVNAYTISIIAYGTSFNVKAYPEEKMVITTLVEGEVKIEGKDTQEIPFIINMQPNQKVTYYTDNKSHTTTEAKSDENQLNVQQNKVHSQINTISPVIKDINVKTELYTSWKDSRWIIEGEEFGNLVVMLERRYNVSIIINAEELCKYHFSGIIENETLEQLLEILRLTIPLNYSVDTGEVYLSLDNKLQKEYRSAYN